MCVCVCVCVCVCTCLQGESVMCMLSLKFGLSVFVFGDESVKILLVDASDAFIILL